jgi:hypothetical protein
LISSAHFNSYRGEAIMDTNKKPNPSNQKSNERDRTNTGTTPDKRKQGGSQEQGERNQGQRENQGNR